MMPSSFRCDHVRVDLDLGTVAELYTVRGTFEGARVTITTASKDFARLFILPGTTVLDVGIAGPEGRE